MDLETVRALGANGLEYLRLKSTRFEQFDGLFAPASLMANRMMLSAPQSAELDRKLDAFLQQLAPFFTLPAAHKALEWLLRRYELHRFNGASIIRHLLPFHATKVFVRLVQLLDIKSDDALWAWLKPLQKSGAPIDRDTLVRHALQDSAFLNFLCSNVCHPNNELASDVTHMANMWMSIVVGVLEAACTEELLQQILPSIVFAVKSIHANLRAAGYVVLSAVARKQQINESVLINLLEIIIKHATAPTLSAAIGCLAVLAVAQSISAISANAVRSLLQQGEFIGDLVALGDKLNVQPLCALLVNSGLRDAFSDPALAAYLLRLIAEVPLQKSIVRLIRGSDAGLTPLSRWPRLARISWSPRARRQSQRRAASSRRKAAATPTWPRTFSRHSSVSTQPCWTTLYASTPAMVPAAMLILRFAHVM